MPAVFDSTKEQTIALLALFQSVHLADCHAYGKTQTAPLLSQQQKALVQSVFTLDPKDFSEIYPNPALFTDGRELLETLFFKHQKRYSPHVLRYAFHLLQIERLAEKQPQVLADLSVKIDQLSKRLHEFESLSDPRLMAEIAKIYVQTIGTLKLRIQIKGAPQLLQTAATADHIRTVLLAGIRAAHLWRQIGGRKWHLIFYRRRILEVLKTI
jgi:high frequency lysogenization protein